MAGKTKKTEKKTAFDIIGGNPDGITLETLCRCGFDLGNFIGVSFRDGNAEARMPGRRSDWLAIDIRSLSSDYFETGDEPPGYVPSTGGFASEMRKTLGTRKSRRTEFFAMDGSENYLDSLAEFIRNSYGKNAVILDLRDASWILTDGGDITAVDGIQSRASLSADAFAIGLESRLGCMYIRTPTNIICRGGTKSSSYYPAAFYGFAGKMLGSAVENGENARAEIEQLSIEAADAMDSMRRRAFLVKRKKLAEIESMTAEQPGAALRTLDRMMANAWNEPVISGIQGCKARIWRDRKDGRANLKKAASLMRISADSGTEWAKEELLGMLWDMNTPESLLEMVSRAYRYSEEGNITAKECIG